jgi:hypothetical protein
MMYSITASLDFPDFPNACVSTSAEGVDEALARARAWLLRGSSKVSIEKERANAYHGQG